MDFLLLGISLIILLFSAILHEVAHGFVADRLGDPTARLMGRLTLNPKSHIDPFMSIALPLLLLLSGSPILFGAAKPVPVDPFNLRDGRKDMAIVALAGPLTNVLLALLGGVFIRFIFPGYDIFDFYNGVGSGFEFIPFLFFGILHYNLLLAIFNLLPIPPLDGSKLFSILLPDKYANSYLALGQFGTLILLFLLLFPVAGFSLAQFVSWLLFFAQNMILR